MMELQAIIERAVSEALGKQKSLTQNEFDLVGIKGASQITGYSINSLYKMTSNNEIPFIKRPGGRKLFFSKKAIEAWLLAEK